MDVSPEELRLLRKAYGKAADDASYDAIILAPNRYVGPSYVPSDPGFYEDLKKTAEALGVDPKGLLIVLASESNLNPGTIGGRVIADSGPLKGHDVTPRGLPGFTKAIVPGLATVAEWDAMPKMTAREQLPFVLKLYKYAGEQKGRPLSSNFELYLTTAAPSALSSSGRYNLDQTMYGGRAWESNFSLDHGLPVRPDGVPAGPTYDVYAQRQGVNVSAMTQAEKLAYAKRLAAQGILKGRVTLGDLVRHLERMQDRGWRAAWQLAWRRYQQANGLPVEPVLLRAFDGSDDGPPLASFPSFVPPSSAPLEGGPSHSSAAEPAVPLTASGALDFREPVYPTPSLPLVAAGALALIAGYHLTRK